MKTLEELHAHYKAVRDRLNNPPKKVAAVRLIYPEPVPEPEPMPEPEPVAEVVAQAPAAPVETPSRKILSEVAEKHGMGINDFRNPSRKMRFINLRHEACYRLSVELHFSLTQIGRLMGNKDHTTVLNAIRRHKKILAEGYKPKTRRSRVAHACVTGVETQTQNDHA